MSEYILSMDCKDAPGIIHKVTGVLFDAGFNITEQGEYVDSASEHFFMRAELDGAGDSAKACESIKALGFPALRVRVSPVEKKRIVMFCGTEAHCPGDLLIRNFAEELQGEVLAVISNRQELEPLVQRFELPFHCIPADGKERGEHEQEVLAVLDQYSPDCIVLAKYMRILSAEFVERFPERIINIHHSFLPAFVGARPYHRAHERGVKIIGATAHFVDEGLDEGPIISQDVVPVSHRQSVSDLIQAGRDVEKVVLARALRLVLDQRVMVHQNRTIVFE